LEELCRVLKTGRHLAIMPYTRGVEKDLFIGGYSTAVKHTIPKRDYSSEAINELLEGQPHEIIGIHGINYFYKNSPHFSYEKFIRLGCTPYTKNIF